MLAYHKRALINLTDRCYKIYAHPQESVRDCLEVQEILLQKITYIERKVRERKSEIKALKSKLGGREVRLSKDDARKAKYRIEKCHFHVDQYQDLIDVYKDIGDVLAFSYIDRWDIKPLSIKESPGTLSGKKGTRLERKILRKVLSLGHVVLLNDLTHCLRYGDITAPKDGKFMVFEVKSGKHRTERDTRQAAEATKLLNYLITDTTDNLYKQEGIFKRVGFGKKEIHHRTKVNGLISDAIKDGNSIIEAESGLFYFAFTDFKSEVISDLRNKCTGQLLAALLTRENRAKANFPIILTIQDAELSYKFYEGQVSILIIIDLGVVESKIRSHGLNFRIMENDDEWVAEIVENEVSVMKIGNSLWSRLYSEFISLDWLINEVILHLLKSPVLYPQ